MKSNQVLETIEKTREYLSYIERHYNNVQSAWRVLQAACRLMHFIGDDITFLEIDADVKLHDLSKLSMQELVPYRKQFYPTQDEDKQDNEDDFREAWEYHQIDNPHHWQTWTSGEDEGLPEVQCVHMVIDWMAMSYELGGTAKGYYEKNKDKIKLPKWAVVFIYEIFDHVYRGQ